MTTEQEIQYLADQISPLSPALAVRLRAVAARVAHQERVLDEMAEDGREAARAIRAAWLEMKRSADARRAAR